MYLGLWELPRRNGKLKEIDKFDASFFEVSNKQANSMDPMLRMLLEVVYEAILNAGERWLRGVEYRFNTTSANAFLMLCIVR